MPELCDAACQKLILDGGMQIVAARLYGRVMARVNGVRAIDYENPEFFAQLAERTERVAEALQARRMNADQKARLAEQVNKGCYRAADLQLWSHESHSELVEHAVERTAEIDEWAKQEQDFYLAFIAEVGERA